MSADAEPSIDPKDAAILRSAFQAFARYGLKRTSMADIAAGAGMSRPALYLRYCGKEDIFNALVRTHFQRSEREVARILVPGGAIADTLLAAFHAIDGEAVEAMLNSPHADEILAANSPFAQNEVQEAHERITTHLADWIAAEAAQGRMSLKELGATPDQVASLIMATKFGIKSFSKDFAAYRAAEARVAAIFAKALSP